MHYLVKGGLPVLRVSLTVLKVGLTTLGVEVVALKVVLSRLPVVEVAEVVTESDSSAIGLRAVVGLISTVFNFVLLKSCGRKNMVIG